MTDELRARYITILLDRLAQVYAMHGPGTADFEPEQLAATADWDEVWGDLLPRIERLLGIEELTVAERPKRAANGEGSIYQRSDGRWVASISVGQGRRKDFYGHSRDEALARRDEWEREQAEPEGVLPDVSPDEGQRIEGEPEVGLADGDDVVLPELQPRADSRPGEGILAPDRTVSGWGSKQRRPCDCGCGTEITVWANELKRKPDGPFFLNRDHYHDWQRSPQGKAASTISGATATETPEGHIHRWILPSVSDGDGRYVGRCDCGAVKEHRPFAEESSVWSQKPVPA